MRFAIFDFECTSLKSDQGFLLCGGIKELGKEGRILGLHEFKRPTDKLVPDRYLAASLRNALEEFDVIVGWNSKMFDVPFLNDRLLLAGEREMEKRKHIDMMYYARAGLSRFTSSKLDWQSRILAPNAEQKTALDLSLWKRAEIEARERFKHGRENYDYILSHCLMDLAVTEQVYDKLKKRVRTIHV
jgi:uncharacterized protein YprB with RNaseH-like and TPR domain